ncbi:energy transducer TonB [Crocinitomix catalasitica]|uniref:energy transducer TonB n=1 Tax=Crocinitomix catalasitica TaxID=184607 RepID=UPI0006860949|nr:energy transducer TonB [Crocinitomix catalasitica]
MKYTLIIVCLIFAVNLNAQKLKNISQKVDDGYTEKYTVLKSDKSVRHGEFALYDSNKNLFMKGYYQQNEKDSVWTSYTWNGEVIQKYNYTTNKLEYFNSGDEADSQYVHIDSVRINAKVDSPPAFISGERAMALVIQRNVVYPPSAVENGEVGMVYVYFEITVDGKAVNHKVVKGASEVLDKEAIRVIKKIPDEWVPSYIDGKPVHTEFVMPVNFRLG